VFAAMLLLFALLAWKVGAAVLLPAPPRASLLSPAAENSAGYLLVVGHPRDTVAARRMVPARGDAGPGRPPLPLRTLPWPSGEAGASAAPLARLLRSLGYTAPPVLLTVDGEGHIVRVQPVPPDAYAHAPRGERR
jgi:hypothetical protein